MSFLRASTSSCLETIRDVIESHGSDMSQRHPLDRRATSPANFYSAWTAIGTRGGNVRAAQSIRFRGSTKLPPSTFQNP
jgi:hypothetical protein